MRLLLVFHKIEAGLSYRYDNQREGIVGWNPVREKNVAAVDGGLYKLRQVTA